MFLKLIALLLCITYVVRGDIDNHDPVTDDSATDSVTDGYATDDYVNNIEDCPNITIYSKNVKVKVTDCPPNAEHCPLYKGTNHTVTMTFEPTIRLDNETVYFRVYGVFNKPAGLRVPYGKRKVIHTLNDTHSEINVMDSEPKVFGGGYFDENKKYTYASLFPVSSNYPTLKLEVEFLMQEKKNKTNLMCFRVKVEIMDPVSTDTTSIATNEV